MKTTGPTKTEIRDTFRDIREALRQAEKALAANDYQRVIECLGHWAAPSAGSTAGDIAEARDLHY